MRTLVLAVIAISFLAGCGSSPPRQYNGPTVTHGYYRYAVMPWAKKPIAETYAFCEYEDSKLPLSQRSIYMCLKAHGYEQL